MKYFSVCDGIGAVHIWHEVLGWECVGTSEIAPFPAAVVEQRYGFKNYGDFTKIDRCAELADLDILAGGPPCQDYSLAGNREGMDGANGLLSFKYLEMLGRLRSRWLVYENVPGLLSANKGRALGSFLGKLAKLGYGWAYRILNAEHFGVPQRRRRVFIVGHLGDWRRAAAVLFERQSLSGDSPPRKETRKDIAATLTSGTGSGRCNKAGRRQEDDSNIVAGTIPARSSGGGGPGAGTDEACSGYLVAPTLDASYATKQGLDNQHINSGGVSSSVAMCLTQGGRFDAETETLVTHTLKGNGHDGSEGRGVPLVTAMSGRWRGAEKKVGREARAPHTCEDRTGALDATKPWSVTAKSGVRRLTPRECERLQGFKDDHTLITYRKKPAADAPRYEGVGNSMARPCMLWIGQRIEIVDALK